MCAANATDMNGHVFLWRLFLSVPHPRKCTKCESLPTHGWAVSLAISFRGLWIFFIEGACGLCYQSATLKLKAIVSLSLDKCLWNHGCHGKKPPSGAGKRAKLLFLREKSQPSWHCLWIFVDIILSPNVWSVRQPAKNLHKRIKACIDDMSWELRVAWDRCILKCTSVLQPMFLRLHSLCMLITSNYPADICRLEWTLRRLKAAGTRWALDNWRIWRNLRRFGSDLCVRCFHRSHENFKLSQTEGLYPMHLAVYWPPSPFHRTIWLNHPEAIRAGTAFRARNIRNWNGKLVAFRQLTR